MTASAAARSRYPRPTSASMDCCPLIDQIADRHDEIESLIKTGVKAFKDVTAPDRKQEWSLSILLVIAVLIIIGLSATLSFTGHFTSDVAFVMGTALGDDEQ